MGKLVHDFKCNSADNMYYNVLANRVRYFKEERGVQSMCKIFEDMINETKREVSILTTIKIYRDADMAENEIEDRVMKKFDLSRESAKEYMLGKNAWRYEFLQL